ncbi:glycine betaine/L-proline ABC transporter ATP-binding protein [Rhodoferax saidenbachensis]|uniref:Quaternary amine transport ATP-binding protein n=1 Tax=Rhodoferax saidenbachensis TaxID=1484693 RepID=A0ABU1ZMT4_9BURK|nr:glycine betaine/L-proline ABC transporter ATP-binding protein [Rhodoferax saidenbachensis]MDR7306849.1 glycine betaine/proline transport system ATP-binding protein [Rhodoferax saidenbachensis]
MSDLKISVKNLYKIFGNNTAPAQNMLNEGFSKDEVFAKTGHVVGVNRVSFDVNQGEIYVLMGLSGSGKSTLIRLINRLVEPTDGMIIIDGQNIARLPQPELVKWRRKRVAMVFQSFALMPHRSVLDNAAFGLEMAGTERKEREKRAMEVLAQVGLHTYAAKYPHQLSGGMQQRVGLARALAVDPDILLMDEAFSALDPLKRVEMQTLMLELQREQKRTILFVSHDLEEALRIGNRIAIMEGGQLVQEGTAHQIITQPANAYVRRFFEGVDTSRYLTAADLLDSSLNGHSYHGGPRLSWSTPLPDAMKIVMGLDEPVGVFDAADHLLGCISARSLLVKMSQEARHV